MQLFLATSNPGKIIEIRESLADLGIEIRTPGDLPVSSPQPEETGETFAANALLKARYYHQHSTMPTIADDSGIMVESLTGELGIHTRRWGAGPAASDAEWIAYFLDRMQHEQDKRASFVSVLALVDGEREEIFEGRCDGIITDTLEADYLPGLPISACFRPDGCEHVFSALSVEEKNRISHRGKACVLLHNFLSQTSFSSL